MKSVLLHLMTWAVASCLAGVGCMHVGPDYSRPELGIEMPDRFLGDAAVNTAAEVNHDRWWEAFNDPALNRAVAQAVSNNPDIARAAARVMEARAAMTRTDADRYPSIDINARAVRQQQEIINPFSGDPVSVTTDTFSLSLPATFELDLWGRLARASQAARADLLAAEENRRTVVQSLVAETVSLYLQIRSLKEQIRVTRNLVSAYEQNRKLVENRYERGLTSVLDVHQARRSLAQAEARIPSLIGSEGQAGHALAILQGLYPDAGETRNLQAMEFQYLPPVPAGLPARLLERRPDIRAAEAALEAACARIGVARAARFPQISLTGSLGYSSDELNTLLDPASRLWQLAASGLQPVFDAGRRAAGEQAARARYRQQQAVYAGTVLQALAEVEDALLSRQQLLERHSRLQELLSESEATLKSAQDRYQRGLVSYLNVLDAQQFRYQAQLDLVQAQYAIYASRVRLHRALGGGWDQIQ